MQMYLNLSHRALNETWVRYAELSSFVDEKLREIMEKAEKFTEEIEKAYQSKGDYITLGTGILNGECFMEAKVNIPLKTLNRHGLISGATGTGKTKTLQLIAGALSSKSIPVLLMDIKGDLSGIAKAGEANAKIKERHEKIGLSFDARGYPVELLTLSNEKGVKLRATVSEFGPVLLSKILGLNDTQAGVISIIFKYCDDNKLPLLDLKDLKKTIQYITNEGKDEIEKEYGNISTSTTGIILRKLIELEQQGADQFFGEKSFEVDDLLRVNEEGVGYISIVRLTDIQDKPKLFSTFMLSLLAEIYSSFPEEGDLDQPKLVIFIDEAHLIFEEASKALLDQLEAIIKLIRSKGVGIFFCTQSPSDIPASILGQLGLKVQHAFRAFTAKDRKAIKLVAENYPTSEYYDTAQMLTSLGIGEAFITALNEKGVPTPLVATLLAAPTSRMGILSEGEVDEIVSNSKFVEKYNTIIDSESAYELLNAKIEAFNKKEAQNKFKDDHAKAQTASSKKSREKSALEQIANSSLARQIGRTFVREATRGLLGVLGMGGRK